MGANKGYNVAEHMGRWSRHAVSAAVWHREVLAYAREHKRGFLKTYACGNCGACKSAAPPVHARSGGRMHLLELTAANRELLRHLVKVAGLERDVHVHDLAASNASGFIEMRRTMAGDERASLTHGSARKCDGCTERVQVVTLDEFVARQQLGPVYTVSIDTEGSDGKVLEGMDGMLRRRQAAIVEFEVQRSGFRKADGRSLHGALQRLERFGYSCFWQFPDALVPASGECWRERFGQKLRWSNMLCAHEPAVVSRLLALAVDAHRARVARGARERL